MKYAVPVSGGIMSPHFGHCEQFALFDVEEQKKEISLHRSISLVFYLDGWRKRVYRWL